ncbi:MAG: ATP synthase F0 subunit C [Candidatus Nomurabacteria bacterium]|nr:ATP synthase F0 subunit C [Candidatus Nomurabacteria bacterium]
MENLAFSIAYAMPAMGAAIGVGIIGNAALNAIGRNPEKANVIQQMMILVIAFTDALAIIGIIVAILGKVM